MASWRIALGVLLTLTIIEPGRAQTYALTETTQAGSCFHIQLTMSLRGELRVHRDNQIVSLPQELAANHDFFERVLSVGSNGLPNKSARVYENAKSIVSVNGKRSEHTYSPEHRLFVAQQYKDRALVYSPAGRLALEELELAEHFDTLALAGLLPGKEVAAGATWQPAPSVVQSLCSFEGLTEHKLVCKLEEVKGDEARISLTGTAEGIDLGALVKLTIDATYQFDLGKKCLTRLDWNQKEERGQGPASPAASAQTKVEMTRTAIEQPAGLSDAALVSVPDGFEPAALVTNLSYKDPKGRFVLTFGREWQTVSQNDSHVVLRLMEQGEFVAQATITPWIVAEKGSHLSAADCAKAMDETPGWVAGQELQSGEVPAGDGRWIYRISAFGKLDGTEVLRNFYVVAGSDGRQVVLSFELVPKQANQLGNRDISLAENLDFPTEVKNP